MIGSGHFRSYMSAARSASRLGTLFLLVISASCNSGVTDNARVASIELEPDEVVVAVGAVAPLTAVLRDAGGNAVNAPVIWTSSDTSVARVSASGVVTARQVGDAKIAVTAQGISATADVNVSPQSVSSVRITPNPASVRVGGTTQLLAEALDGNGNLLPGRSITWTSSSNSIASIDNNGVVTGRRPGAVTITATSENRSGTAALTVNLLPVGSIVLNPTLDTLHLGETLQLAFTLRDENGNPITGRQVSWKSSLPQVASVTSGGNVTALAPGKAIITATSESRTATSEIVVVARPVNTVSVTPLASTVEVGSTVTLSATLRDDQGSVLTGRDVNWISGNTSVATVNGNGVVTGVAPGTVNIQATSEGRSGSAAVTVTAVPVFSVTVSPGTATILTGRTTTLTATARSRNGAVLSGRQVRWTSGANGVATVADNGVVTGVSQGTVFIFAEVEGVVGSSTVTVQRPPVAEVIVTPASPTVGVGETKQMVAIVRDGDRNVLDRQVTWSSSDDTTVFITSGGIIIPFRKGSATITATVDGVTGSTVVTVN